MRVESLRTELVEFMPPELEDSVIYVSFKYGCAIHHCACGCGYNTVTGINIPEWQREHAWDITLDDGLVTLHPSIGNFQFPCRSHYWIRRGKVEWC